ncbi:MAG: 1-phosphofructokinase family hexose kinase [Bacteroidota bacterium]
MLLTITLNPAMDRVYFVDDFAVDGVFRARQVTATAGGKGLNVARVAHLLGEPVLAAGFIGGRVGQFIAEQVREQGITGRFTEIEGESRLCLAVADQKRGTSTEILEAGPVLTAAEVERFLADYDRMLDECQVVAASGSLPQGLPADFYRTLIEMARAKGREFILDTSGEALRHGLAALPYMIKPNQDELAKLLGTRPDRAGQVDALRNLQKTGIQVPCLTLGKDGCLAALADGVYHYQAPPVEVVNAVGSGDSFVAGCAVALRRGAEPKEAIMLGMACGTANTQFVRAGMIESALVQEYLAAVKCERVVI